MTQSHCKPLYPCCLLSYCVYCCHIWWPHRTCQNQPSSHASNLKGIFCQCQFTSKKDVMLNFWRDISAVMRKLSLRLFDTSQACAVSAGFPSTSSSSVETLWCLACIDKKPGLLSLAEISLKKLLSIINNLLINPRISTKSHV